jgi:hypothetical protein
LSGVDVSMHIDTYTGPIPTFSVHAYITIKIGDFTFYADNALYGGSDDHVFVAFPHDELKPYGED